MAAYQTLRPYPALHFFANIIDPTGKHKIDDVIAAVKKKFNIESTNRRFINTLLKEKCERKSKADMFAEIYINGYIRLNHCYTEYTYKDNSMKMEEHAVLEVNNKVVEKMAGWDDDKMSAVVENIKTMFSAFDEEIDKMNETISVIFDQIWEVFPKGSKSYQYDMFFHYGNLLNRNANDEELRDSIWNCAFLIRDEYFKYLWSCHEEEKPEQYIQNLTSFMDTNYHFWKDGSEKPELMLKIFTDEHQEAIKVFMREPEMPFNNSLNILILKVWKALENNDETLT